MSSQAGAAGTLPGAGEGGAVHADGGGAPPAIGGAGDGGAGGASGSRPASRVAALYDIVEVKGPVTRTANVAINDAGMVLGEYDDSVNRAVFTWTAEAGLARVSPEGANPTPGGLNNLGVFTADERQESTIAFSPLGFSNIDGSYAALPQPPGYKYFGVAAVNDSNVMVGALSTARPNPQRAPEGPAFSLVNGRYTLLDRLPLGRWAAANSINAAGTVVGSSDSGTAQVAVRWDGRTPTPLGTLGKASNATDINSTGSIVGGSLTLAYEWRAFLYVDGAMEDLGVLTGKLSYANAINDGSIVVGYGDPGALAWTRADGWVSLNDRLADGRGWVLWNAADVNSRGQIVGSGSHDGVQVGFVLTPRADEASSGGGGEGGVAGAGGESGCAPPMLPQMPPSPAVPANAACAGGCIAPPANGQPPGGSCATLGATPPAAALSEPALTNHILAPAPSPGLPCDDGWCSGNKATWEPDVDGGSSEYREFNQMTADAAGNYHWLNFRHDLRQFFYKTNAPGQLSFQDLDAAQWQETVPAVPGPGTVVAETGSPRPPLAFAVDPRAGQQHKYVAYGGIQGLEDGPILKPARFGALVGADWVFEDVPSDWPTINFVPPSIDNIQVDANGDALVVHKGALYRHLSNGGFSLESIPCGITIDSFVSDPASGVWYALDIAQKRLYRRAADASWTVDALSFELSAESSK
ncbi:MAG TPA: hypothetical protein VNG33_06170, partial [Polyangiaceae bacterium]|nr:hypothetical protein [Polyangiaceae bacterium]